MRIKAPLFLLLLLLLSPSIYSEEQPEECYCFDTGYSVWSDENKWDLFSLYSILSHNEGKGIGYHQGYTTLEFFLMPSFWQEHGLYPFLDLRGHGLDNQKLAANAGVGIRYLFGPEWIAGLNIYYDFRQGEHHDFDRLGYTFQEISVGFEALGPHIDFRLNLYQPFGKKISNFTQTYFFDNAGIIPTIFYKEQYAEKGFDAEIGGVIGSGNIGNTCWKWNLYLAGGPYYLQAEHQTGQWGGKARFEAYLGRYIFIKGATSYDCVNRGTAQICIGLNVPLYPFTSIKPEESYFSSDDVQRCTQWRHKISQPTQRMEIMPLRNRHVTSPPSR